jgi:hypothetical protein
MRTRILVVSVAVLSLLLGVSIGLYWSRQLPSRAQQPSTLQPTTSGAMSGACTPGQGVVVSTSGVLYPCYFGTYASITPFNGTTGSLGGSLLAIGGTATATVTIQGAVAGQPCEASASDGTNMAVLGLIVHCDVTAPNTATVTLYAIIALTPVAKTYNVRIP